MLRGVMTGGVLQLRGKWRALAGVKVQVSSVNLLPLVKVWQPVNVSISPDGLINVERVMLCETVELNIKLKS